MSNAEQSYRLTCLYEAERLVDLTLRHSEHPFADDENYRQNLLDSAAEVLQSSIDGVQLYAKLKPDEMNRIAAIWFVEEEVNGFLTFDRRTSKIAPDVLRELNPRRYEGK